MNLKINFHNDDLPDNLDLENDIAIDTEAMGLNLNRDRLCLVQLTDNGEDIHLVKFNNNYNAPNLRKLLNDNSKQKIFHYARFDLAMLKVHLNVEINNIFCTKIASKLVRTYTDYHGLKDLCRDLLNVQISKKEQSSYWGADNLSEDQLYYAATDVVHLHKLRETLSTMLKKEDRFNIAKELFNFLPTRIQLDIIGWNDIDIFAHH